MSGRTSCRILAVLLIGLPAAATAFTSGESAKAEEWSKARHEKARQLFLDACTACHTLDRIRVQRLTKEEWRSEIAGMLSEGVPLTDAETSLLCEYLGRYFGPDAPPQD